MNLEYGAKFHSIRLPLQKTELEYGAKFIYLVAVAKKLNWNMGLSSIYLVALANDFILFIKGPLDILSVCAGLFCVGWISL